MTLSIVFRYLLILTDGHSVWYPRPFRLSAVDYRWIQNPPSEAQIIDLIVWND